MMIPAMRSNNESMCTWRVLHETKPWWCRPVYDRMTWFSDVFQ